MPLFVIPTNHFKSTPFSPERYFIQIGVFLVSNPIILFKEYDSTKFNTNCDEIFISFYHCIVMVEILIRGTETARVGSQARLQCIARDYDNQPRKISWFHNGRLVLKSSRNTITELFNENKNGYTLSELQIPEVRMGDAGRYVCKTDKKHQASLYLTVNWHKSNKQWYLIIGGCMFFINVFWISFVI